MAVSPLYLYLSRLRKKGKGGGLKGYREVMEEEGEWLNGMALWTKRVGPEWLLSL